MGLVEQFYLLHDAAEAGAVGGGEEQATEMVDTRDGGLNLLSAMAIAALHAEVHKPGEILLRGVHAGTDLLVAEAAGLEEHRQQGLDVLLPACEKGQRGGVGDP